MRLVQIGLGGWGLNWATEIVPQVARATIVGCVFRDPDRVSDTRARWPDPNVPFFPSLEDAIDETKADGVLVLTTTDAHASLVNTALSLGCHVLVEKPFVPTLEEGRALAQLACERGLILMVNQNFRFFPAAQRAAQIVQRAEFGQLGSVAIRFNKCMAYPSPDRARRHQDMRQPMIMDLGIHHFDLMRMVIGTEPRSVYCTGWNVAGSAFRDPANATAILTFDNGVVVTWHASWEGRGDQTTFSGEWSMQCEKATVAWACRGDRDVSLDGDRVHIVDADGASCFETLPKPKLFGRAAILDAFVTAGTTGSTGPYFPDAADNLRSIGLMEAALRSQTTGTLVNLPPPGLRNATKRNDGAAV